jgi:DNA-binding FrmR family transcriptional regulator
MVCCEKRKDLINRLSRVEGHLKKVRQMVKDDAYCIDIINQSLAVQSALRSIDELVLKNHLETCVRGAMISNKGVEKKIEEFITTLKYMRK